MKLSGREQIGTGAKSFANTAKPLFIGSIPIAASNQALPNSNSYSGRPISLSSISLQGVVFVAGTEGLVAWHQLTPLAGKSTF